MIADLFAKFKKKAVAPKEAAEHEDCCTFGCKACGTKKRDIIYGKVSTQEVDNKKAADARGEAAKWQPSEELDSRIEEALKEPESVPSSETLRGLLYHQEIQDTLSRDALAEFKNDSVEVK